MHVRLLTIAATVAASLAMAAPVVAMPGDLTFDACAQGPASATAPCTAQPLVDRPTALNDNGILGVTSAADNTAGVINGGMQPAGCYDDGVSGSAACIYHTNAAIDDPEGLASFNQSQAYVAGDAHDAIAELFGSAPNSSRCIAEGGALGCDVAHGLHHPTRMAITPDGSQLYAATGDGVAWFDVARGGQFFTLSFAGCAAAGGADGCADAPVANEQAIAISPDGTSVYVGSTTGTIVGLRRAADGSLTTIATISGLPSVNGLVVSPDGTSLYAVSTLSGALITYARAADGTISQSGCLSTAAATGCTADADLSTVNSVAISPDGLNVYTGDTQADAATFDRANDGSLTPAGCLGATGGPCVHSATVTSTGGAIVVSGDGEAVYVAAVDRNDVSVFTREQPAADLALTATLTHNDATTATATFTVTDNGPYPARAVRLVLVVNAAVSATSVSGPLGACGVSGVRSVFASCPLPDLAPGASAALTVVLNDRSRTFGPALPTYFRGTGTIEAEAESEASDLADPTANDSATASFRFSRPRPPLGLWNVHVARSVRVGSHHASQLRYHIARAANVTVTVRSLRSGRRVATVRRSVLRGIDALTLPPLARGPYRVTLAATPSGGSATQFSTAQPHHVAFNVGPR
jgi:hypothetical protein